MGHEELASAIAGHPVVRLANPAWAESWLATAGIEARIVAYADKRAGQRLESMTARFESWGRRYPVAPHERGKTAPAGMWSNPGRRRCEQARTVA